MAICYLNCILRSCCNANRGWVNVVNVHKQRFVIAKADVGPCVGKEVCSHG
jgi:hypothetical protein